ncbi:exonuclease SbcCD subunit D [Pseudomaricurvus alkylphenolicus]|jgi:exonuclease SbcD|uniref:exonuclease SbcCD subunit D n=1 Tax=Pseudomaricurvus alkylphenolicus TaxID=1306991 RepID=UPI0014217CC8|nr:exonuclease SbcCD subunit D [Pseudomaricurvus alkylphenolicus]NIB44960.1 exonuclease SbcCD subunit D [Pseudomaricurvus alkylphenolicus]
MKILHTSDWHLGRQFHNISLLEDQRHVLQQLVTMADEQCVDAVIVAGDIYDRSVPPTAAVSLLDEILHQFCQELKIPVIMIAGNHDSAERLGFGARQLLGAGLHVIGPLRAPLRPVILQDEYGEIAFYAIPYVEPAHVRDRFDTSVSSHEEAMAFLTDHIHSDLANSDQARRSVVISHCFLDGAEESDSERPLSIGGADRVSPSHFLEFDYVALGHLHGPQYKGAPHVRYSGSILKYSFSEQHHHKSATLVTLDKNGGCEVEKLPLEPLRDMRVIEGELQQILADGRDDSRAEDYLLVRLTDRHAILDAMGKLREVYPNVLHLERPGLTSASDTLEVNRERLQKGELNLFEDFFTQVQGESMSDEQHEYMKEVIEQLHRGEQSAQESNT